MRTHISHQPIVSCFRCLVCRRIKLQLRDGLCTGTGHQPIMSGFRYQVCRLVKLELGDCLGTPVGGVARAQVRVAKAV